MKNKENVLIDLIDYLLEDYGGDACGKCAYCQQADENGDVTDCQPIKQDGNKACRCGMIKYFMERNNEK